MRSVVIQSYKTVGVPGWIDACMASVREWATLRGHAYLFQGDAFLDRVPDWYRKAAGQHMTVVTDLARLLWAKELLVPGSPYDRVIWMDADLLVFDPQGLSIDVKSGFTFCREFWPLPAPPAGQPNAAVYHPNRQVFGDPPAWFDRRVNNAVSVFVRGNTFLEFYISACQAIVASRPPEQLGPLSVSTNFLTILERATPLPLLPAIGTLGPVLLAELAGVGLPELAPRMEPPCGLVEGYIRTHGCPIAAANLSASLVNVADSNLRHPLTDAAMLRVIDALRSTRGEVVKRYLLPSAAHE